MEQLNWEHIIQETEKNLKNLWGNVFYEEVKDFFRNFITVQDVDKILVTRRSYVLYKIFCKIFAISSSKQDDKVKKH